MANFSSRIAAMAAASPDLVAIEVLGAGDAVRQTTYRDLDALAGHIAAWLQGTGVARGDRAAILADNDAAWIAAYLGVLRLGAVAVPLDTAYKAPQVRTVLADSGARVLFTTERYLDTARQAGEATTLVLLSGRSPGVVDVPSLPVTGAAPPIVDVDTGAAAVILYTSGTTADPKGVVLTHANLDAERESALAIVPVGPADAILGVLPLFHALAQMANLLLPLSNGARIVFLETVSSSSLLSALASRGITVFACVPQFFYLIHQRVIAETAKKGRLVRGLVRSVIAANAWLRDKVGWNPGRLFFGSLHRRVGPKMRVLITGGSKFDAVIGRDLYGMGFTILNAYGLTETSGGATMQRPGDRFTTSVGQPFGGVEIRIEPETRSGLFSGPTQVQAEPRTGTEKSPDLVSDGEILIRGPIIMRGYFNRPDATNEALKDGWLYTGDLGRLDDQGRLYITGRKKEIIVLASGKNLYPEEIEAHYRQSAFIKELCILGLSRPGEPSAERLHALVVPDEQVLRERGIVNVGELVRFELESLAVQLPAYKRILSYDITLEPLPRTTTGKIKRREVEQIVLDRAGKGESASRETTDAERAWLAAPGRTDAMALIAARLSRERVQPDDNLELDLALDSMERVELLTVLEERQGTRVAPEVRATIFSVRQLLEAVEAAPSAGAGDEPGGGAELPWATLLASDTNPTLAADLSRRRPVFEMALFVGLKIVGLLARVFLRFRVRGLEHLPASGPMLLCPNHQTRWDGLFLGAALPFRTMRQLFVVAAAEYFETPLMRRVARVFNIVPIDPDANLVTAMQAGASGLRLGKVLMLFPEGERSIDGDVKKFRKGAAILSAHLDAPIVPIAVDGLFNLWPRGRPSNWAGLLPWRAKPVTLVFGAPLRVRAGDYTEGTAQLRAEVVALLDEIRSSATPPELKRQRLDSSG